MPRAERKRAVGVPETTYDEMTKLANKKKLFIGEVVELAWEAFKKTLKPKRRSRGSR